MERLPPNCEAISFSGIANALVDVVDRSLPALRRVTPEEAAKSRGEGRWNRLEILGHLIDSAANNHHRYVRAQESLAEFSFPSYSQDDWVSVQGYADADWGGLVAQWESYNRHLVRVIARIPTSFEKVACRIGSDDAISLLGIAKHYVDHTAHHLEQIVGPIDEPHAP